MVEDNNKDINENSELHKDEEEQQRKDDQRPEQIKNKVEDIENKRDKVNRIRNAINETKENKTNDSKSQPSNKTGSKEKKNSHNPQSPYDRYKEGQQQRDAEKKAREKREAEKKSQTGNMSEKEKRKKEKQDYYDRHKHSDPSKSKANINRQRNARRAQKNAEKQGLSQGAKVAGAKAAGTAGATGTAGAAGAGATGAAGAAGAGVAGAGVAAALPVIIIVVVVILLIIMIIGIILFFQNMPGEILGKVKEAAINFGVAIRSKINGDSTNISKEDEIALAQYLENMGYNVEGYGFADVTYSDSENDTYGTRTSSGKAKNITGITSDSKSTNYLKNYMAADESSYFKAQDNILGYFKSLVDNFESGTTNYNMSTSADYSTGMIEIDDTGTILDSNIFMKKFGLASALVKDATTSVKSHVLTIKSGKYDYAFQLDGWTSKYGRPLELFLALHLSTMMPDLTNQIATSNNFNTKVHIGLESTKLYAKDMSVTSTDGTQIERKEIFNAYIKYLINLFETAKANYEAAKKNSQNNDTLDKYIETAKNCISALNGIYDNEDEEEKLLIIVKNASQNDMLSELLEKDGLVTSPESIVLNDPLSGDNSTYFSGLTDTQLNELVELYAKIAGGQDFKLPFITRVSKNWFWDGNKEEEKGTDKDSDNNVYFTSSDSQYTGVYKQTKAVKKWITYFPNEKSSLKGFEISIHGVMVSSNGKDLFYQVNEPLTEGPNDELLSLFNAKYYKYDGTEETARKIAVAKALDKEKVFESRATSYYQQGEEYTTNVTNMYGNTEVNYYYHGDKYSVTDEEKTDGENNELPKTETPSIGTKKDTLSSFEILKNMDTEDSETIYRMLKQFVTSDKLADVIGEDNVLDASSITEELKHILIWPFKKDTSRSDFSLGTTSKDKNKYGLIISDVDGLEFEAPIDCEVTKVDGDTVTLKLGSLSDKAYNALSFKYRDDFYTINKDLLNGWTMIVKGISGAKTGNVSRGDSIGTAEDKVTIVLQRVNKTVIGGENDTNEDNIENYMDSTYTKTEEDDIATHGIADEEAPIIDESLYGKSDSDKNGANMNVSDVEREVFRLLTTTAVTDKPLNDKAACAIMGIIYHESRFGPNATNANDGGYGLIQWTFERKTDLLNWLSQNGYSNDSIEGQMKYFFIELENRYGKSNKYDVYDYLVNEDHTLDEYLLYYFGHDEAGTNYMPGTPVWNRPYYNGGPTTSTLYNMRLQKAKEYYANLTSLKNSGVSSIGTALLTNTKIDRETFIADVRKQASQSNTAAQSLASAFVQQAGDVYDICVAEGINPVWVAAQSFWESHWVSGVYNYYGMLKSIGNPIEYSSLEEGLRAYIKNIKNRLDPTTSLAKGTIDASKRFSPYNSAFTGGLNNVYDVMASYVGEGYTDQDKANRAYEYLHDCIMQKIKDMFGGEYLNYSVTTN